MVAEESNKAQEQEDMEQNGNHQQILRRVLNALSVSSSGWAVCVCTIPAVLQVLVMGIQESTF